jgi:hypothetical protein
MDYYDNANLQHVGCRWRPVHRVWARLAGSGRGHEGRLSGAKGLTATNGAISTFQGRVQSNPTAPALVGNAGYCDTNDCDWARVTAGSETNAPSLRVCEVCRASSCIITRRCAAENRCLCTVEMHVALDGSGRMVSRRHECAACERGRDAEIERERERRVRSAMFASSFGAPAHSSW